MKCKKCGIEIKSQIVIKHNSEDKEFIQKCIPCWENAQKYFEGLLMAIPRTENKEQQDISNH